MKNIFAIVKQAEFRLPIVTFVFGTLGLASGYAFFYIFAIAIGLFGLAVYCPGGSAMRAVVATALVWIVARIAFWIGYHRSAAMRGLGAPGMAQSMIVLLYVASRFGYEIAGQAGAVAPVAVFVAVEAFLFWATQPVGR